MDPQGSTKKLGLNPKPFAAIIIIFLGDILVYTHEI